MKKLILIMAGLFITSANAVLIDSNTVIPDENILQNFSGLDWVYAGPIAPNEFGAGNIQTPDYRAAEGWRYATVAEWATRPDWTDFIIGNANVAANAGHTDHSTYRFASEYWGNFSHVDLNDADAGRITNGLDIGSLNGVFETWFVRDSNVVAVPEPSSLALILLGFVCVRVATRKS